MKADIPVKADIQIIVARTGERYTKYSAFNYPRKGDYIWISGKAKRVRRVEFYLTHPTDSFELVNIYI